MASGHYTDDSKRAKAELHPQFKHGKYVGEKRSESSREQKRAAQRRYYAAHPERRVETTRRYREANKARIAERNREYRNRPEVKALPKPTSRSPEYRRAEWERHKARHPHVLRLQTLRGYGLTVEGYDNLLMQQNGVCAICGKPSGVGKRKRLSVDHDHDSGKVRGLLCVGCNTKIGQYEAVIRNPRLLKAVTRYLEVPCQELA
jgi:hypothetical protein